MALPDFKKLSHDFHVDLVRVWHGAHPERSAASTLADGFNADGRTTLRDGHFVVVSDVSPADAENGFVDPRPAVECVAGVRSARALLDPDDVFGKLQQRAIAFTWDRAMRDRADRYITDIMVGLIEEVQKGLAGLQQRHEGRLINCRAGLVGGLLYVNLVHHEVLRVSDNNLWPDAMTAAGVASTWSERFRQALSLDGPATIVENVIACIQLYVATWRWWQGASTRIRRTSSARSSGGPATCTGRPAGLSAKTRLAKTDSLKLTF